MMARLRSWWRRNVIDWDPHKPETTRGNLDLWDKPKDIR